MNKIILGTDEAGYGPNLGPLAVALTAWEADAGDISFLFEPLTKAGIHLGDSKKLYHTRSIAALEAGLLATQLSLNKNVSPIANDKKIIEQLAATFTVILQQYRVRLFDMYCRSIEPKEFNQLLNRFDSKGALLSDVTLRLIVGQLDKLLNGNDVLILCDKHGGRNYYLDLLTEFFPGEFIQVVRQSRESSIYRLKTSVRRLEFRFLAKGESHLPIALASMFAKYQRELAMIEFNDFWRTHIPDILPTAGYPEDAKRFKKQVADVQRQLGIADDTFWRLR